MRFSRDAFRYCSHYRLSIFLVLCIFCGGTAKTVYLFKLPLFVISLFFIGWILTQTDRRALKSLFEPGLLILAALPLLYVVYLIPLPSWLWSGLASKTLVVDGYQVLDQALPVAPLSLTPEATLLSIFSFLPVIAIVLFTRLTPNKGEIDAAVGTLWSVTVVVGLLGILQILMGETLLRFYETVYLTRPVGPFSNINHFASLMVVALPFCILMASSQHHKSDMITRRRTKTFGLMTVTLLVAAIVLAGSSAGYLLLLLCLSLSVMSFQKSTGSRRLAVLFWLIGLIFLLVDYFIFSGEFLTLLNKLSRSAPTSRSEIFQTTWAAIQQGGAFGYGPGSFSEVYKVFEQRDTISINFVNEAHNEYLQLWFEFGYLGLLWIIVLVFWMLRKAEVVFRRKGYSSHIQKASLISLLMLALHSVADYPLRTIAIAAVASFLLTVVVNHDEPIL